MLTQVKTIDSIINTALEVGPQHQIEYLLKQHFSEQFTNKKQTLTRLSRTFLRDTYVCLESFAPSLLKTGARGETSDILAQHSSTVPQGKQAGVSIRASTIAQADVEHKGVIIPSLYYSQSLRQLLSLITACDVIPCRVNTHQSVSIIHGSQSNYREDWRKIERIYMLVWFIATPKQGGALEFLFHATKGGAKLTNSKTIDSIQKRDYKAGDAFLLKTNAEPYQSLSISHHAEQAVVTMTFSNAPKFDRN